MRQLGTVALERRAEGGAARLAATMVRDGMCRELYADMLGFLGLPAGMGQPHLAYLLKATVEAFSARSS